MKRFFVDKIDNPPVLTGENHKHLSVVLRAKIGEEVILCTGDGTDCICRIESVGKSETVLSVEKKVKNCGEPSIDVTLFMSVMKGDKNDLVVQKATELGAAEIFPVITRYVQSHDKNIKVERLNKIALEAARQCGRSKLTKVHDAINFDDVVKRLSSFDLIVFPYEKAMNMPLKTYLNGKDLSKIKSVAIIIGSEGGFADEEAVAAENAGAVAVTLGKRILRAETANIAVLSAVMYELGQWE